MTTQTTPAPANGAGTSTAATTANGAQTDSGLDPKIVAAIAEALKPITGQLAIIAKDIARERKRTKGNGGGDNTEPSKDPAAPETKPEAKPNGASRRDDGGGSAHVQAMRLGRSLATLPEAIRTELEQQIEDGDVSIGEALARATLLEKALGAAATAAPSKGTEQKTEPKTPPGKAETAPTEEPAQFRTWADWTKARREDHAGTTKYWVDHPNFEPTKLPGGPDAK